MFGGTDSIVDHGGSSEDGLRNSCLARKRTSPSEKAAEKVGTIPYAYRGVGTEVGELAVTVSRLLDFRFVKPTHARFCPEFSDPEPNPRSVP